MDLCAQPAQRPPDHAGPERQKRREIKERTAFLSAVLTVRKIKEIAPSEDLTGRKNAGDFELDIASRESAISSKPVTLPGCNGGDGTFCGIYAFHP
jgi:hypothetical protein